jgi:hypothetical protein
MFSADIYMAHFLTIKIRITTYKIYSLIAKLVEGMALETKRYIVTSCALRILRIKRDFLSTLRP